MRPRAADFLLQVKLSVPALSKSSSQRCVFLPFFVSVVRSPVTSSFRYVLVDYGAGAGLLPAPLPVSRSRNGCPPKSHSARPVNGTVVAVVVADFLVRFGSITHGAGNLLASTTAVASHDFVCLVSLACCVCVVFGFLVCGGDDDNDGAGSFRGELGGSGS